MLAGKRDRARQLVDELKNMTAVSDAMREELKRPTLQVIALAGPAAMFGQNTARPWDTDSCIVQATLNATAGLACLVLSLDDLLNHWCQPACRHLA